MEKTQREYYLNEQMKAIQKELGDDEGRDELADLEEDRKTKLSKEAREKAQHELKKLRQMSPMSRKPPWCNYLDWLLSIPWNRKSRSRRTSRRRRPLDDDHYGLEGPAHRRISRGAVARQQADRSDPVSGRPPGVSGPRSASRSRKRPAVVRAGVAQRRARRGGDPRSSPHLYQAPCPARSSSRCARRKPRILCSCWTRSTRWAPTSARRSVIKLCSRCLDPEQNIDLQRSLSRGRLRCCPT